MHGDLKNEYHAALVAGPRVCVACGRPVELTADGYANHKCPKSSDAARKSASTRHEEGVERRHPLWERLQDGFVMLEEDDDGR